MGYSAVLLSAFVLCASDCVAIADEVPSCTIYRAGTPIKVDGRLNELSWVAAPAVGEFRFPWWQQGKKEQTVAKQAVPKPADVWRLNLNRLGGKTNPQFSQWSAGRSMRPQFHAPRYFGRATFSGKSVPF